MTTEHTVVRSGKLKRKPFNSNVAGHSLTIATFGFSYPRVSSDTPSFAAFTPVAPGVRFKDHRRGETSCLGLCIAMSELGQNPTWLERPVLAAKRSLTFRR
jgi:hypothetical protein